MLLLMALIIPAPAFEDSGHRSAFPQRASG